MDTARLYVLLFPRRSWSSVIPKDIGHSLPKILDSRLKRGGWFASAGTLHMLHYAEDNARLSDCYFLRQRTILHIAVT